MGRLTGSRDKRTGRVVKSSLGKVGDNGESTRCEHYGVGSSNRVALDVAGDEVVSPGEVEMVVNVFNGMPKEFSKAKIMADLNMMMKRGKIAGKPTSSCNEYEFSCRNTPRHPLALFSSHKKHKNSRHHLATSNPPLAIDYSDDIVINAAVLKALDILKSATMTSPPLSECREPHGTDKI
ncbi:hypothetical protein Tco_1174391 [Tanacetum coccineum]